MSNLTFSKTKQKELERRLRRLNRKYNDNPDEFSDDAANEIKEIEKIMQAIEDSDNSISEDNNIKHNHSLFNNAEEEWYRAMLLSWGTTHESAKISNQISPVYKFALHFFVDNVVLNPKNSRLNYEELVQKFRNMTESSNLEKKIYWSLDDIQAMVAMLASMELRIANQPLNSVSRQVSFEQQQKLETDIDPRSELAFVMRAFKKQRQADKRNRQQNED